MWTLEQNLIPQALNTWRHTKRVYWHEWWWYDCSRLFFHIIPLPLGQLDKCMRLNHSLNVTFSRAQSKTFPLKSRWGYRLSVQHMPFAIGKLGHSCGKSMFRTWILYMGGFQSPKCSLNRQTCGLIYIQWLEI